MKKLLTLFLALLMALSLLACQPQSDPTEPSKPTDPTNTATEAPPTQPSEPVDKAAHFTVEVTDLDGTKATFTYSSEAATVGEALLAEGLIAGEMGDWGMMVTTVNGITADWNTENAYWAFYINGEYAQTGVDGTELTDGATYAFVKTVSYTVKGEGATTFYFTVKNVDNTVTCFEIHTDKTTVGAALTELGLVEGSQSDWGLFVTTVNGITADWDTENAYWAFYIGEEYAQTGVDSTDIVPGTTYTFAKTVSE